MTPFSNYIILSNIFVFMGFISYQKEQNYIFKKLINDQINLLGEELIKGLALKTSPEQLPELTDMNLGLCNLMVRLNSRFALCSKIWYQSIDFQLEILNCIEFDDENIILEQQIVIAILENTSFDLCDSIYKKFGDIAITTLLEWYCITKASNDKKKKWMKICNKNPGECMKWMMDINRLKDISLIIRIISVLNPCSDEVIRVDKSFWTDIFYDLDINQLSDVSKVVLAHFFMPIILLKEELFPNDFVRFSFDIIYNELAEQKFDYKNWERLEKLLPEMSWYKNWDKCKRLKKAMNQKGYKIHEIESN